MHKSKLRRITLALLFAFMPFTADAAGLGKLTVISGLGEPLSAEIELLSTTPEELSTLTAAIAPEEAYAVQGLERTGLHNAIQIEVSKKPDGTPILRLTTRQPVSDPFLDMLIQVDWSTGRLLREYTVLLDPPGYTDKAANGAAAPISAPTLPSASESSSSASTEEAGTPAGSAADKPEKGRSAAPASAEARPEGGEEYTTVSGDTLNSIAKQMQVEGVSLEQMLVGLYNANKDAFVGGNMNRLKVGQIIRAPSAEELQSVTPKEASREIRVHTADWNAYRNKLAGIVAESAPAAEETSPQTAGGKITAPAQDKAAAAPSGPRDVVKLSKSDTDPAGAGNSKALQDRINALQEEVTAKEKSTQEANERTAMLEKQIADMQKLLAVKNQALADAQKNAAKPAPAAAPAETPKADAPKPEAPKPETPKAEAAAKTEAPKQPPVPQPAQPEAAQPVAPVTPPAAATTAQPKADSPKPAKPKKVAPPPPPIEEPGMLDGLTEDPMLLAAAGGGLVLLGGGWLFLRNRRRRNLDSFEQGILTAGGLKANTVFGNTAGGTVDTGDTSFLTDFSQSGGGMIDTHDVDPIAEAEVYMAYGRDAQAEEILKDAIAKEPKRYELHIKLLEILANRKDTAGFETIAGELYSTLGSSDPTWAKVAELGHQLEPNNPLYDTKGLGAASAAAGAAVAASVVTSKLDASDFENVEEMNESSLDFSVGAETAPQAEQAGASDLDFDLGGSTEVASEKPLAEMTTMSDSIFGTEEAPSLAESPAPVAEESNDLDFDLGKPAMAAGDTMQLNVGEFSSTMPGLDMPESPAVEEQTSDTAPQLGSTPESPAESTNEISFDLPEIGSPEPAVEEEKPLELPQFDQTMLMEAPSLDTAGPESATEETVSFELPDLGQPSAVEPEPTLQNGAAEEAGSDLDFNFDVAPETPEPAPAEETGELAQPQEIDLSGISLDFGPTIDNPAAEAEVSSPESVASGESAEVETKLDLVTAYMEMGDKEGARELLDEVLKEGGPQQKARAQEMLSGLG